MHFKPGILLAFVVSANLANAHPVCKTQRDPAGWDSATAEAAYKTGSVAGAAIYFGCRVGGAQIAGDVAAGTAIAAAGAEAAVKWSKTDIGKKAGDKIKGAAGAVSGAAKYVGNTAYGVASAAGKATSGALSWATGSSKKKQPDLESQEEEKKKKKKKKRSLLAPALADEERARNGEGGDGPVYKAKTD